MSPSSATETTALQRRLRAALVRLVGIADTPDDNDDVRLRKRAGVLGGYLTIVAPLGAPAAAATPLIAWAFSLGLSLFSVRPPRRR